MIARLTGMPEVVSENKLILDVAGVGYGVMAPPQVIEEAQDEEKITLLTHLAVREDALDLYGFHSQSQLSLFRNLLDVSGVGPKSALGILSVADAPIITSAIAAEDTSYLTKVSGIGKKTAEKVILELKDRFDEISSELNERTRTESSEAVEALLALGYSSRESQEAIAAIDKNIETTEEKVKAALKQLDSNV